MSLVHSYTGVQLLRLEGRQKDAGGSRTLKSRWVRLMWKLCPLFSFRKKHHLRLNLHVKQGGRRKITSKLGTVHFHPILAFSTLDPPSPQVEVTSGSNSPLFTRGLVIRGYED